MTRSFVFCAVALALGSSMLAFAYAGPHQGSSSKRATAPPHAIDGWVLQPTYNHDPADKSFVKDGDELDIYFTRRPSKLDRDVFKETLEPSLERGALPISAMNMKGYLETTEINHPSFPHLIISAALMGKDKFLLVRFTGKGDKKEMTAFVRRVIKEFPTKWRRLYEPGR